MRGYFNFIYEQHKYFFPYCGVLANVIDATLSFW